MQYLQFCINIFVLIKSDLTMEIEFSWDEQKAEKNLKKHGVALKMQHWFFMMLMPYINRIALKMVNIVGKR